MEVEVWSVCSSKTIKKMSFNVKKKPVLSALKSQSKTSELKAALVDCQFEANLCEPYLS